MLTSCTPAAPTDEPQDEDGAPAAEDEPKDQPADKDETASEDEPADGEEAAAEGGPQYGGTLNINYAMDPLGWDPRRGHWSIDDYTSFTYERLLIGDIEGKGPRAPANSDSTSGPISAGTW